MSNIAVNSILDASGGTTTTINGFTPTVSNMAGRNLIVNGAMNVVQRSITSLTGLSSYNYRVADFHRTGGGAQTVGRHGIYVTNGTTPASGIYEAGSAPQGFTNSLKYVVEVAEGSSTGSSLFHSTFVEGSLFSNANFGTSNALPLTFSFYVKSSIAGRYEIHIHNNTSPVTLNRVSYTINSANTWERKTITLTPATIGVWNAGTDCGIRLDFLLKKENLGVTSTPENTWATNDPSGYLSADTVNWMGTAGATFYITGMQLELGEVATPFEHRPYGLEVQLCRRYYFRSGSTSYYVATNSTSYPRANGIWSCEMRGSPSITFLPENQTAGWVLSGYNWGFAGYQGTAGGSAYYPAFEASSEF